MTVNKIQSLFTVFGFSQLNGWVPVRLEDRLIDLNNYTLFHWPVQSVPRQTPVATRRPACCRAVSSDSAGMTSLGICGKRTVDEVLRGVEWWSESHVAIGPVRPSAWAAAVSAWWLASPAPHTHLPWPTTQIHDTIEVELIWSLMSNGIYEGIPFLGSVFFIYNIFMKPWVGLDRFWLFKNFLEKYIPDHWCRI